MGIVSVDDLKAELSFTADMGAGDDALLARKLAAAEGFVERYLGFTFAANYGGIDQEPVPPALSQAVVMLAAHWYDNRNMIGEGREVPFAVTDIISAYRDISF